jgi:hypothetical protein
MTAWLIPYKNRTSIAPGQKRMPGELESMRDFEMLHWREVIMTDEIQVFKNHRENP